MNRNISFLNNLQYDYISSLKLIDTTMVYKIANSIKKLNNRGKVFCFGNGGSASISNHFLVDLSKVCNVSTITFNESKRLLNA